MAFHASRAISAVAELLFRYCAYTCVIYNMYRSHLWQNKRHNWILVILLMLQTAPVS